MRLALLLIISLCACGQAVTGTDGGTMPPCLVTDASVECVALRTTVRGRDVYWRAPDTAAPDAGRPAVVVYQGSFFGPSETWGSVPSTLPFGGYQQARLQALLLEHGFTVVAPAAIAGVAWQTNSGVPWELSNDKPVIDALLAGLTRGDFGPVDATRLYATGISSGGYMTSRMALSEAGRFRALAIESASWATCAGPVCVLPATLPVGHPPTLFLHGRADATVPLSTALPYVAMLTDAGVETDLVIDDLAGHEWLPVAPERITAWFEAH